MIEIDLHNKEKYEIVDSWGEWAVGKIRDTGRKKWTPTTADVTSKDTFALTSNIFCQCPFKDFIFKNYTVIGVALNGSSVTGIYDDVSDYDLAVYILEKPLDKDTDEECLFYRGRKVHWYYWNIQDILTIKHVNIITAIGLFQHNFLNLDSFIYVDYKYINIINDLLTAKHDIGLVGVKSFLYYYKNSIDDFLSTKILASSKLIGTALLILKYYKHIDIDNRLILKCKRSRYVPLDTHDLTQVYYYFNQLDEFAKQQCWYE